MKEKKKSISIRKLAALERAKALGLTVKRPAISALERRAQEWKQREEARESNVQGPRPPRKPARQSPEAKPMADGRERCGQAKSEIESEKQDAGSIIQDGLIADCISSPFNSETHHPFSRIQNPASRIQHQESRLNEGFDWKPYKSERDEVESKPKKPKNLNSASIAAMARKIMAREWAMALGRSRGFESEQAGIERKAEQFRQKKAAERERREIEEKRANEQRKGLEEALRSFGRALLKTPKPVTPETAEALLEKALTGAGEIIRITWQPDGCHIWVEPWEEKRLRRKSGVTIPAVFQAAIDDNLMLTSYQKIEDSRLLRQIQDDIILKNILSNFRKATGKDFQAFEDAVSERGRIIRSMKRDSGWKINFEPWEEMRKRNVERGGRPPVVTYVLKADKDFEHISCARGQ
ncbi:MAG: hypothetical protein H8D67_13900 [Deltaproteobacteria bacterium]|nr:hypothetical protein [Deltaproteobacteria bacterium]